MTRGVAISCVVVSLSVAGRAHAQTPGQVPVFGQPGTGSCNAGGGNDCVDSVITQDANGNIGIGTDARGDFRLVAVAPLDNSGVYGVSLNNGFGVEGYAAGFSGIGVYGAGNGSGVYGYSPSGWAVVGQSGLLGFAGYFVGRVGITTLGTAGGTSLCRNVNNEIADCSSSLRYKTGVRPFAGGLDILNRLRPIAFTWKEGGAHDVGLAAEDVEQVEPLLTFRNRNGEIEGVKYNQLSAVFVNAINEQQVQIKQQQAQIDALKALVCASHPGADVCR